MDHRWWIGGRTSGMQTNRIALAATLLAVPVLVLAADGFDYVRRFTPTSKERGIWTGKFNASAKDGELVGLTVEADWWEGPGDGRPGDDARAPMEGFIFEVRRGEGAWTALPTVNRDLRLVARTTLPPDSPTILGGSPVGEWSVRQVKGAEVASAVRVEFTLRGDPLLVTDLRVADMKLPGLDPPERVGRPWIPDRTELRTLEPGAEVSAVVTIENCGARRTKECDLDLLILPYGVRTGGKRLAFIEVPRLAPGTKVELSLKGKIPEDYETGGSFEIVAWVDPRGVQKEVEPYNNLLTRAFTLVVVDPSKQPDDLRDR